MPSSATTEVNLANMALTMLGQQPISALTDSNNRAVMANARYADVRDSVLRAHPWNCAVKRDSLTARAAATGLLGAPKWGYTKTYALPSDFVRMVSIEDPTQEYTIEAGNREDTHSSANDLVLLTDASEMNIKYIYRLTNVAKMDDTLKHAIAVRLAAELAHAVTGDSGKEGQMMQKYQAMLMQAQWEDSVQHNTTETIHGGLWLESRYDNAVFRNYPNLNSDGSLA
ncbi:MAG: hypothetical protein Unbinned4614contig1000_3 [Prokaryotic dsDNA virus sp.]|nr:MAG: hypothetical protein Unbinned4614contig1000_3 [Prokaryotic dsDNA virus sp.]|tara:strand:- start:6020 stop:6700 length:681 start_codon:yes stop_codon:yes gene_type:complete